MASGETQLLFSWDDVDALPDLRRLTLVLAHLPDADVIEELRARRGRGRNEYPVAAMWRALVAGVVFQHSSIESLLRELKRNPALLTLCGFNPLPLQAKPRREVVAHAETGQETVRLLPSAERSPVPSAWNFSRFLTTLEKAETKTECVTGMMDTLRGRLTDALPDFGTHLGNDGKAFESHSTGQVNRKTGKTSDADADWGKHETHGHRPEDRQVLDEGQELVRLRLAPDCRYALRDSGGCPSDPGVALGVGGALGDDQEAVR